MSAPRRSGGRRGPWAPAPPVLAVLVALLLLPSVQAGVGSAVTLTAPFHHAQRALASGVEHYGCGSATATYPTFSLQTGNGTFRDSAQVPTRCPGSARYDDSEGSSSVTVWVPLSGLSNGTHTITVQWEVRATGAENFSLAKCTLDHRAHIKHVYVSSCGDYVLAGVLGQATIDDETTGTSINPTTGWAGVENVSYLSKSDVCYPSTCYPYSSISPTYANGSFAVNTTASWTFTATFTSTDTYWLVSEMAGDALVEYFTQNAHWSGALTGTAHVDLQAPSGGISLLSVKIH